MTSGGRSARLGASGASVASAGFVGLVSDTHGLLRPALLRALAGADLILHAGDVGEEAVLAGLRSVARVVAVRGNVDSGALCALPETALVELAEGRSAYLLHDLGRLDLDPRAAGVAVVVSGHSHQPRVEERDGVLYVNPGSAGPRRFRHPISAARLHLPPGGRARAELIDLPESA